MSFYWRTETTDIKVIIERRILIAIIFVLFVFSLLVWVSVIIALFFFQQSFVYTYSRWIYFWFQTISVYVVPDKVCPAQVSLWELPSVFSNINNCKGQVRDWIHFYWLKNPHEIFVLFVSNKTTFLVWDVTHWVTCLPYMYEILDSISSTA